MIIKNSECYESDIPAKLREKVENELKTGEQLIWMQVPIPYFFTKETMGKFLLGIFIIAFMLFWICGAAGFELPDFREIDAADIPKILFPLFGVPFLLIGIFVLLDPLWTYKKALETVYVITNTRALIIERGWTTSIRSFRSDQLTNLCRKERSDGTGDIVIVRRVWADSDGNQQSEELGFFGIKDPKYAEQLLFKLSCKVNNQ